MSTGNSIPKILPEHIATEQPVVHPALDWRDGVLIMGLNLTDGTKGVITSEREILSLNNLPFPTCDRSRNFGRSPITEKAANLLLVGYGRPETVDSAYALIGVPEELAAYYRRFIIFPKPWWPEVLALWTLGTYVYPIFNAYPYLRISSPEPGCGKSLLGELIAKLSFNGELMVSPTEANVFRLAEEERGTQIWDEVENQQQIEQSRLQTMISVLLNGYRAGGAVPRQERTRGQFVTIRYHVYVPRVLIGLSDLPPVVQQRTIEVALQRRGSDEPITRYNPQQQVAEELELRQRCALWALTYCKDVAHQYSRNDLSSFVERYLGQAGRLVDDLLLPLVAIIAAAIDHDERSRGRLLPMLRTFMEATPELSSSWKEGAKTTPAWLVTSLEVLEEVEKITPAALAQEVSKRTGVLITAERLSRGLKKYGLHSCKNNGTRVFQVADAEIAQIRSRYRIADPGSTEAESLDSPPEGQ